jgi:hypothetical protein
LRHCLTTQSRRLTATTGRSCQLFLVVPDGC